MSSLFPTFSVPTTLASEPKVVEKFLYSPYFQVETGDFLIDGGGAVLYGSGYDAWVLWCLKTIHTERNACLAYPSYIGVEMEEAFREPSHSSCESAIERTITEALLADPKGRTVRIYDFDFSWVGETVDVSFTILSAEGDTASLTAKI